MKRASMKRTQFQHKSRSQCRICRKPTGPGTGLCETHKREQKEAKRATRKRTRVRDTKPAYVPGWRARRAAARKTHCELCGCATKYPHVDHIAPYVLSSDTYIFTVLDASEATVTHRDPDDRRNLISVCNVCHGKKKPAENCLLHGDVLGYFQELNRQGWPMERVDTAMRLYGLGGMR